MASANQQRILIASGVVVVVVGILIAGNLVPGNTDRAKDALDKQGEQSNEPTSLHAAAAAGNIDAVITALQGGQRIDTLYAGDDSTMVQMTPLMLAAAGGHTAMVQALIDRQAQLDTARPGGMTAIMFAARAGSEEALFALLNAGASLDAKTERDRGPLFFAAESGSGRCVTILLDAQADANAADSAGVTPLMIAATAGSTDAVLALLNAGANPGAEDQAGNTALSRASGTDPQSQAIASILRDAMRP
jgi:ankyrin repeat protein